MRVALAGAELEVDVTGEGPETILLVHGLGSSRRCWAEAPRFFEPERHALLAPDLPGFGGSRPAEGFDFAMASHARVLEALLAHLGARRVHLVAHSMGGAVALLLAGAPGLEVASFAAAEGNLVAEDAFMSSKVARLKEDVFVRVHSKWLRMAEESVGPVRTAVHEAFLEDLRGTAPLALHRTSVDCQALTRSGELGRRFAALACPRLYLAGEGTLEGRALPPPVLAEGVSVARIPCADHFVMGWPDAFYAALRRHVDAASGA